jgi:chaperonin GroES
MSAIEEKTKTEPVKLSIYPNPLEDRIVLEPIAGEDVTEAGFVIPDTAKEKPQKAVVLKIGPGKIDNNGVLREVPLIPGNIVLHSRYSGTVMKERIDGKDHTYIILGMRDILAVHGNVENFYELFINDCTDNQ